MTYELLNTIPLITENINLLPQAIISGLLTGMVYALVAAGLALIWGVVDIVNFAHGEYMMAAMYVTLVGTNQFGVDPLFSIPVNALFLFVAGYLTYKYVISRVMDAPMLAQILATFGLLLVIRYGMLFIVGPSTMTVETFMFDGSMLFFDRIFVSYPTVVTAVVSVITLGALFLFMNRTKTGKAIRATSQDWEAARVMGIDPNRVNAITWGIGLAVTGIAGSMVATFFPVHPELTPTTWTLIAFASVALGGFGSVLGAVFGGLGIALAEKIGTTLLNPSYKEIYVFIVFILALLLRNQNILRDRLT
jgi:branched-chain amino acid transport system permease protein